MKTVSAFVTFVLGLSVLSSQITLAQPLEPAQQIAIKTKAIETPSLPIISWIEFSRTIGGPTLLTLQMENATAPQVLAEISKQIPASYPINVYRSRIWDDNKKTATVSYTQQPFWVVMRDLAQKFNFRVDIVTNRPGVLIYPSSSDMGGREFVSGPCLTVISTASYGRSLRFSPTETVPNVSTESLNLMGRIYLDPKLRALPSYSSLNIEEASDDKGQSLKRETSNSNLNSFSNPSYIELKPALKTSQKLTILKGTMSFAIVTESEDWEIPDILNAKGAEKTLTRNEVAERYAIEDVKRTGDGVIITMTISQSGDRITRSKRLSNGRMLSQTFNVSEQLQMFDTKGHYLPLTGQQYQSQGDRQTSISTITLTYGSNVGSIRGIRTMVGVGANNTEDDEIGEPAKLLITIPRDWKELQVPFEFKDLPLP